MLYVVIMKRAKNEGDNIIERGRERSYLTACHGGGSGGGNLSDIVMLTGLLHSGQC